MYNYEFKQDNLSGITKELIREVINAAYGVGITLVAPLGTGSDDFILHGNPAPGRFELVSIRIH